uniref:CUB domain-containing protein n=1 Tax=Angiostrongylus cantonensis TaxID=6313 RepID=A0A0K0CWF1_ANGCA
MSDAAGDDGMAARVVRRAHGTLESPAFPTPYRSDLSCLYNISTVASNVIHLTFLSFDLAEKHRDSGQCLEAYVLVIVVDRLGKEHIGKRLCGTNMPAKIETMQPTLHVQFVTTAAGRQHRGFRIRYEIISEVYSVTEIKNFLGEIVSPGYPTTFPRNATCYWLIRVEPRQRVYIRLEHLYLSSTIAECERASLSIMDGYKHDSKTVKKDVQSDLSEARFCGSQLYYMEEGMKSYLSSANRLLVRFNTKDRPSSSLVADRIGFKDQGVCVMRPQLCIDSSLVCNGVQNCVEGDYSDERH